MSGNKNFLKLFFFFFFAKIWNFLKLLGCYFEFENPVLVCEYIATVQVWECYCLLKNYNFYKA